MDLGISGRRAAVAAASDGLGFAAASALADDGAIVAICGRDESKLDDAVARLGSQAVGIVADVSTEDGAAGFVRDARDRLGGVDILVTNAGGPAAGTASEMDLASYRAAIDLNLLSVVAMCHEAVPGMRAQAWGRVVAITSHVVTNPSRGMALSVTARSGATGFIRALALELVGTGVTANSIEPGPHDTARLRQLFGDTPLPEPARLGDPTSFGQVVAFLCSQPARFVNGTTLPVDGGSR